MDNKNFYEYEILTEEALKYKSADEFIGSLGKLLYHGTDAENLTEFKDDMEGGSKATHFRGHYFTDDENIAELFGDNLVEAMITYNKPVVIDYQKCGLTYLDIQQELDAISKGFEPSENLRDSVEEGDLQDWDVAIMKNANYEGTKSFTEYIVKNANQIKTKYQLKEIWDSNLPRGKPLGFKKSEGYQQANRRQDC